MPVDDEAGSPAASGASFTPDQSTTSAPPPQTESRKAPPPEKPSDARRRSFVISAFWAIVLLLGLPIWWMTTSIYRANLPLSGMVSWADGKVA